MVSLLHCTKFSHSCGCLPKNPLYSWIKFHGSYNFCWVVYHNHEKAWPQTHYRSEKKVLLYLYRIWYFSINSSCVSSGALFNQLTLYITRWRRTYLHKKGKRVQVCWRYNIIRGHKGRVPRVVLYLTPRLKSADLWSLPHIFDNIHHFLCVANAEEMQPMSWIRN